jgi:serine/threonine-protein kinase
VVSLDGSGKTQPLIATPGVYLTPRFAPDGRRLAVAMQIGKGTDIYVYDPQRDAMSHLTFTGQRDGYINSNPVWTPDGKHIVFRAQSQGANVLWWIRADGGGEPVMLRENKLGQLAPSSFSPDGRRLAFMEASPETGMDVWAMTLDLSDPEHPKPGKAEKFYASPKVDVVPMFSPDGHWIAYASDEQGQFEIFVRPFPGPGGVWQVSSGGGAYPSWSSDGKTIFFTARQHIFAADYTVKGDTFNSGKPRRWSEVPYSAAGGGSFVPIDIAPDGKHFAIFPQAETEEGKGNVHVTFLLNFFDEVRRRLPAAR